MRRAKRRPGSPAVSPVRTASPARWAQAFDDAARVHRLGGLGAPEGPLARVAREVLRARRASSRDEPCPMVVVRRVERSFAARPRGVVGRLLALVFDSAREPVAAMRGAGARSRTLRYEGGGATVDVQTGRDAGGRRVLHVAVTPCVPGMTARLRGAKGAAGRRAALDESGTGAIALAGRRTPAEIQFDVRGGTAFRVGPVPVD